MEVIVRKTSEEVSQLTAQMVCVQLQQKPQSVLGMATGESPKRTYEILVEKCKAKQISFSKATCFSLDEYVGLDSSHPQSYRYYMNKNLYSHIDIEMQNTFVPDGLAKNLQQAAKEYEEKIVQSGGIDLQILGIGRNGHIGFNEPTSSLASRTRIKTLTESTFKDNARFFAPSEFQPHLALTMGIETIMEAKMIVLIASGEAKADAIKAMVEGPITAICPASILQYHPKTKVIIDEAAASKLQLKSYYQWVRSQQEKLFS